MYAWCYSSRSSNTWCPRDVSPRWFPPKGSTSFTSISVWRPLVRRTDRGSECWNTQVCSISVSPLRVAKPRVGGVFRRSHRAPICDSVHSTVAVKVSGLLTSTFPATLGCAATQEMRYLLRGLYKTWVGVHLSFCFRKSYPGSLYQVTIRLECCL